ncbi:nitrate reductase associated protein [Phenylobacterium sp.]|uniref:nitrate reductase associated protein n=1 Tax=Phenylobacterium sp. TaxID=1871053 RepID=UPI00301D03B1
MATVGQAASAAEADHMRLFRFEADFVQTLRCIPMCVRFKLDTIEIKLSLRQWSRFTLEERDRLRRSPCEAPAEITAYRAHVVELVARGGDTAATLPPQPPASWTSQVVPDTVAEFAAARGVRAPDPQAWAALDGLSRYAVVKLTRDKHENANFEPALRELGLI